MSTYKLCLPVLIQDGIESTLSLNLSSMITCYDDDPKDPDHRYLEMRKGEWTLVHRGNREWISQREARTRAERATLLVYNHDSIAQSETMT